MVADVPSIVLLEVVRKTLGDDEPTIEAERQAEAARSAQASEAEELEAQARWLAPNSNSGGYWGPGPIGVKVSSAVRFRRPHPHLTPGPGGEVGQVVTSAVARGLNASRSFPVDDHVGVLVASSLGRFSPC